MSELNYKELQEQGVFDIPYKAFEYMQKQHKRIKELELINIDSELYFDAAKDHIDLLQKRIDDAVALLEYNEYVDSPLQALEVLKGGTNDLR